jgi:hypothetical protein
MNGPPSSGHAVCTGSRPRSTSQDDLLARTALHLARPRVGDRLERLQPAHLRGEPLWRLHLEDVADARPELVEALHAEAEAHAPLGAELVDQEGLRRALGALEEKRRPARLDDAVDDLRHLELRVDLGRDANELALALEQGDPLAEVLDHRG